MKAVFVAACLIALPSVVFAQDFQPYQDWSDTSEQPQMRSFSQPNPGQTTYSRDRNGNRYVTTPNYSGGATVRGSNVNTGARWRTEIEPDGDMRGRDADGNSWRYNQSTGRYTNSDGTTCAGKGASRRCY